MISRCFVFCFFCFFCLICLGVPGSVFADVKVDWGGKAKLSQTFFFPPDGGFDRLSGSGSQQSLTGGEVRLTNRIEAGDFFSFTTHYQLIGLAGSAVKDRMDAARMFPQVLSYEHTARYADSYKFMDLTRVLDSSSDYVLYNRLDRLFAAYETDTVTLRIGRQAVTWGNGLIFNPADLVNPFAPTDVEREYKVGDDMVNFSWVALSWLEAQVIYVPRRQTPRGDVEWDSSCLGTRFQFFTGENEIDAFYARNYSDDVVGIGYSGNIVNAAWRFDVMCTMPGKETMSDSDGIFSFVVNIDYSWVWGGKNWYGLVEFYHNGFGKMDYADAIDDPDVVNRLGRGDVFVLGKNYVGTTLQYEATPLVNIYLTSIVNIEDPSAILQPRVVWDVAQWAKLTFGGSVMCGAPETEFGGFRTKSSPQALYADADSVFVWFDVYF